MCACGLWWLALAAQTCRVCCQSLSLTEKQTRPFMPVCRKTCGEGNGGRPKLGDKMPQRRLAAACLSRIFSPHCHPLETLTACLAGHTCACNAWQQQLGSARGRYHHGAVPGRRRRMGRPLWPDRPHPVSTGCSHDHGFSQFCCVARTECSASPPPVLPPSLLHSP